MEDTKKLLCGLYTNRKAALRAHEELRTAGFRSKSISLYRAKTQGDKNFVYEMKTSVRLGAIAGAIIGMLLIGLFFIFAPFPVPVDPLPFNEANNGISYLGIPLLVLLAGAALGAACGTLVGIGTPVDAAHRFNFYLSEGGVLLTVENDDTRQEELSRGILERTNAQDVSSLQGPEAIEKFSEKVQTEQWINTQAYNH